MVCTSAACTEVHQLPLWGDERPKNTVQLLCPINTLQQILPSHQTCCRAASLVSRSLGKSLLHAWDHAFWHPRKIVPVWGGIKHKCCLLRLHIKTCTVCAWFLVTHGLLCSCLLGMCRALSIQELSLSLYLVNWKWSIGIFCHCCLIISYSQEIVAVCMAHKTGPRLVFCCSVR